MREMELFERTLIYFTTEKKTRYVLVFLLYLVKLSRVSYSTAVMYRLYRGDGLTDLI
jgi:hypothetical protein